MIISGEDTWQQLPPNAAAWSGLPYMPAMYADIRRPNGKVRLSRSAQEEINAKSIWSGTKMLRAKEAWVIGIGLGGGININTIGVSGAAVVAVTGYLTPTGFPSDNK